MHRAGRRKLSGVGSHGSRKPCFLNLAHANVRPMNKVLPEIPVHLQAYVVPQEYEQYTAIDQACWRYIMLLSRHFFAEHAHPIYLEGLQKTGITTDRIPRIEEMDAKLQAFGWRAASITGFIPPAVFAEMLSLKIMPIACDMRKLENISYTPAPDIVHEAAGHAPILADPAYAAYLERLGQVARRVIFAKEDCLVYEAILRLSECKEMPGSTAEEIQQAEEDLEKAYAQVSYVSEATQFSRIGWWSIEYGLIRDPQQQKYYIYGAGLLSSVGESYSCLDPQVKKLPFRLDCIEQDYDITKPQPQLYYSDSFSEMMQVLDQFTDNMAYTRGGLESLAKAKRAETITTCVLSSGLQISGVLADYRCDERGELAFLRYQGPTQLSYDEQQLPGQGPSYHQHGYSTPVGRLRSVAKPLAECSEQELSLLGFRVGEICEWQFVSGIRLTGRCKASFYHDGRLLLLSFSDCQLQWDEEILFQPDWGDFDMAVGDSDIPSVFGGAADRASYISEMGPDPMSVRQQKRNHSTEKDQIEPLYQALRDWRESSDRVIQQLDQIRERIEREFPQDWLLRMELLELYRDLPASEAVCDQLRDQLQKLRGRSSEISQLIGRGLDLFGKL